MTFTLSAPVVATEGALYSFDITPTEALADATTIRWQIVPKGALPVTSSDFPSLTGMLSFTSGATVAQTVTFTPTDDARREISKDFELRIYDTADDSTPLDTQVVTLRDNDDATGTYGNDILTGNGDANIIGFGTTHAVTANGSAGSDFYVISRFQYGNVEITDTVGTNLVKFDAGVTITDYDEESADGFVKVISRVDLTLSTGAVITIINPVGKFVFQLGSDPIITTYDEFKGEIRAEGSNETSTLRNNEAFQVLTATTDPDISGNSLSAQFSPSFGSASVDVFSSASTFGFSQNGSAGDDFYVISRFQYGNVEITDTVGTNLIKFDVGVTITDYDEESADGFVKVISRVALTLSTGAVITIINPVGKFVFQLGDDDVIATYAEFKGEIRAEGSNETSTLRNNEAFSIPLPPTGADAVFDAVPTDFTLLEQQDGRAEAIIIGTVAATDADDDPITYRLTADTSAGEDATGFEIDTNGQITYVGTGIARASSQTVTFTVVATSTGANGAPTDVTTSVSIAINELPPLEFSSSEQQRDVATLEATDYSGGGVLTWSLTGGADIASFAIDSETGEITWASPLDFDTDDSVGGNKDFRVTATVTDGAGFQEVISLIVTLTDASTRTVIEAFAGRKSVEANAFNAIDGLFHYSGSVDVDRAADTITITDGVAYLPDGTAVDIPSAPHTIALPPSIGRASNIWLEQADDGTWILNSGNVPVPDGGYALGYYLLQSDGRDFVNGGDPARGYRLVIETDALAVDSIENTQEAVATLTVPADATTTGTLTWSLYGADADLFAVSDSGVVTWVNAPDYEALNSADGDKDFQITVSVVDDDSRSRNGSIFHSATDLTIILTDVADTPIIAHDGTAVGDDATIEVESAENQLAVTTLSVVGRDAASLTWTLAETGDYALFRVTDGVVTWAATPDYENMRSAANSRDFSITVIATDAGEQADSVELTVELTNVDDAPVIEGDAVRSIQSPENTEAAVATLSVVGRDAASLTWSLAGADHESFEVVNGVVTWVEAPDYENTRSAASSRDFSVTVIATTADGQDDRVELTVELTNIIEAPTIEGEAVRTIASPEDQMGVVALSATPEAGDSVTWTLTGADSDSFTITPDGVITWVNAPSFGSTMSTAMNNEFNLIATATGTTGSDSVTLTITVAENTAPTITQGVTIAESFTGQTNVYANGQDDTDGVFHYSGTIPRGSHSMTNIPDITAYLLDGSIINIPAQRNFEFDYSESFTFSLAYLWIEQAGDGTWVLDSSRNLPTDDRTFYTLGIYRGDGTNTFFHPYNSTIGGLLPRAGERVRDERLVIEHGSFTAESAENQLTVTTLTAADDTPNGLTWGLEDAESLTADARLFNINSETGEVTWKTAPDYETLESANGDKDFSLTVTVEDGSGETDDIDLTVRLTDANEITPVIAAPIESFDGRVNAYVNGFDANDGVFHYTGDISAAFNNDRDHEFTVSGETVIYLPDGTIIEYQSGTAADATEGASLWVAPVDHDNDDATDDVWQLFAGFNRDAPSTAYFLGRADSTVGTFIPNGEDGAGQPLLTAAGEPFIVEAETLAVTSLDGQNAVTTLTATDVDTASENLRWSLTGGADMNRFAIDPMTGVITWSSTPDYDTTRSTASSRDFVVTATVSDGDFTDDITLTVTLAENTAPTITTTIESFEGRVNAYVNGLNGNDGVFHYTGDISSQFVPASSGTGFDHEFTVSGETVIFLPDGTIIEYQSGTAADPNEGARLWVAPVDHDNDDATDDVWQLFAGFRLNAPSTAYFLGRADDGTSAFIANGEDGAGQPLLTEAGDPFVVAAGETLAVESFENQLTVTTLTAADEMPDGLTWALTGGADMSRFVINRETGEIRWNPDNPLPDYETLNSADSDKDFEVIVTVTDSSSATDTITLTVTLTDGNDGAPVIAQDGTAVGDTLAVDSRENQDTVTTLTATDGETAPENLIWTLSGDNHELFQVIDGVVTWREEPDYEAHASDADRIFSLTVTVTDDSPDQQLQDSVDLTVTLTDGTEKPVIQTPIVESFTGRKNVNVNGRDGNDGVFHYTGDISYALVPNTDPSIPVAFIQRFTVSGESNLIYLPDGTTIEYQPGTAFTSVESPRLWVASVDHDNDDATADVWQLFAGAHSAAPSGSSYILGSRNEITRAFENNGEDGAGQPLLVTAGETLAVESIEGQTAVASLGVTDIDTAAESLTWALSGDDMDSFAISDSGVVTWASTPDYDTLNSDDSDKEFQITVTVTDETSLQDSIELTVTLVENTAPVIDAVAIQSFTGRKNVNVNGRDDNNGIFHYTGDVSFAFGGGGTTLTVGGESNLIFLPDGTIIEYQSGTAFTVVDDPSLWVAPVDHDNDDGTDDVWQLFAGARVSAPSGSSYVLGTVNGRTNAFERNGEDGAGQPLLTAAGEPFITNNTFAFTSAENQQAVATLAATDATPNAGSLTWGLTSDADGDLFAIDTMTGTITWKTAPDFETLNSAANSKIFSLTATVTDSLGAVSTVGLTVTLTDANDAAPVIAQSDGTAVGDTLAVESAENGTTVTTLTATDIDTASENLVWTLSGDDHELFQVEGGVVTWREEPDYEAHESDADRIFSLTVTVTDDSPDQQFQDSVDLTVALTDVFENTAPVIDRSRFDIVPSATTTTNVAPSATVTPYEDATYNGGSGATEARQIAALTDGQTANINWYNAGITGYRPNNAADEDLTFVLDDSYIQGRVVIYTWATDSGGAEVRINDAEVRFWLDGEAVGTAHTIVSTEAVDADIAVFEVAPPADLVFDEVRITFAGDQESQNLAEVEIFALPTAFGFISTENTLAAIGTLAATDDTPNAGGLAWTLTGDDADLFTLNSATGELRWANTPDFEVTQSDAESKVFSLTATARDSLGAEESISFLVILTDVNEGAPIIDTPAGGTTIMSAENQLEVTTLTAMDIDTLGTLTWSLTDDASGLFTIDSMTGAITWVNEPDYEDSSYTSDTDRDFSVIAQVTDGTNTDSITLTIRLTDANEAPDIDPADAPAPAMGAANIALATDPEDHTTSLATITTSVTRYTPNDADRSTEDRENHHLANLVDGDTSLEREHWGGTDLDGYHPLDAHGKFLSFYFKDDDYVQGSVRIHNREGTDTGRINNSVLEFRLNGEVVGSPTILRDSNVITVTPDADLVFDEVRITFDGNRQNLEEIEIFGVSTSRPIASVENQDAVTTLSAMDVDADDSITWVLSGSDADLFDISAGGVVTWKEAPDFETLNSEAGNKLFSLTATARDSGGLEDSINLAVTLTDENEAPVITRDGTAVPDGETILVNSNEGQDAVITLGATDVDSADTQTWVLSGDDMASFEISDSGVITWDETPNFDTTVSTDAVDTKVFDLTATVTDGGNLMDTIDLTVTLIDVM